MQNFRILRTMLDEQLLHWLAMQNLEKEDDDKKQTST